MICTIMIPKTRSCISLILANKIFVSTSKFSYLHQIIQILYCHCQETLTSKAYCSFFQNVYFLSKSSGTLSLITVFTKFFCDLLLWFTEYIKHISFLDNSSTLHHSYMMTNALDNVHLMCDQHNRNAKFLIDSF